MIVVVDGNVRIRKESFDPHANAMFCFCDNIYLKDYNNMGGTIIHELSHLSALRRLSFVGNAQLHGTLPESWGGLSQLRTLDLDELQLNGTIPESYANLQKLEYLSISASGITGQVPHGIYLLPKLEHLSLSYNGLSGTIPEYGSNTPFVNIWLENNDFTGTIPSSIFNSTLKTLILWGNHLIGTLSSNIGSFEDLFYLALEINSLFGRYPQKLGKFINSKRFI